MVAKQLSESSYGFGHQAAIPLQGRPPSSNEVPCEAAPTPLVGTRLGLFNSLLATVIDTGLNLGPSQTANQL